MDKKILGLIVLLICILCILISTFSCTDNQRARNYGGTETIRLDTGVKLEQMTWKEDELWILIRPMRSDDKPETHTFQEKSSYGVIEGTVVIIETR